MAVVIDLAAGRDLLNRIWQEAQPIQFEEIRQVFMADGELDDIVRDHPQTGNIRHLSAEVLLKALDVAQVHGQSAQLRDQRRALEQHGERVIPGRNPGSVRKVEIVVQHNLIGPVAFHIVRNGHAADHRVVLAENAGIISPYRQIIAVQDAPDIDIRRGVSPHPRKELAVHRGGIADHQFGIIMFRFRFRPYGFCMILNRLSGGGNTRRPEQGQHQKNGNQSFHRVPFLLSCCNHS